MLIDIGSSILAFMGEMITVTDEAAATLSSAGFAVHATPVPRMISANVQPTSPRALTLLPEGERGKESITVTTVEPIIASDVLTGRPSAIVTWHGVLYKAVRTEDRLSRTNHFHTVCTRLTE